MKKKKDVQLIKLTPDLRPALVEMAEDFQAAGEERFKKMLRMSDEDFFALLRDLETDDQADDLPPGMAPQSTYWLIEGGATSTPSRRASLRNSASLSVFPLSSVIDAARNSTG